MTDFQIQIWDRLSSLKQANQLPTKKPQFDKVYSSALVDPDWSEITRVDDFQASFLDLLNERTCSKLSRDRWKTDLKRCIMDLTTKAKSNTSRRTN